VFARALPPSRVLACPALYWRALAFSSGGDGGKPPDICLHIMGDDLPPSQWALRHPKLARVFIFATLLVFAAVTLAWWGFLAWLIWHAIWGQSRG
jgi:hypothetical protein